MSWNCTCTSAIESKKTCPVHQLDAVPENQHNENCECADCDKKRFGEDYIPDGLENQPVRDALMPCGHPHKSLDSIYTCAECFDVQQSEIAALKQAAKINHEEHKQEIEEAKAAYNDLSQRFDRLDRRIVEKDAIILELRWSLKHSLPYLEHCLKFFKYQREGKEFWPNREEAEGNIAEVKKAVAKTAEGGPNPQ